MIEYIDHDRGICSENMYNSDPDKFSKCMAVADDVYQNLIYYHGSGRFTFNNRRVLSSDKDGILRFDEKYGGYVKFADGKEIMIIPDFYEEREDNCKAVSNMYKDLYDYGSDLFVPKGNMKTRMKNAIKGISSKSGESLVLLNDSPRSDHAPEFNPEFNDIGLLEKIIQFNETVPKDCRAIRSIFLHPFYEIFERYVRINIRKRMIPDYTV